MASLGPGALSRELGLNLTQGQGQALRNLARKKAGAIVGWIAIAEAQSLAEAGLAARTAAGWVITPAGEAALEQWRPEVDATDERCVMIPFPSRPPPAGA